MKKYVLMIGILLFWLLPLSSAGKHAITFDDFIKVKRVTDLQLSPDGKRVAFVVTVMNKEENNSNSDLWLVSIEGKNLFQLTNSPKSDSNPRWSPDGEKIAFISARSGLPQVWLIDPTGGEATQLTDVPTGVSSIAWSPDSKFIAFASEVYPDCKDLTCTKEREDKKEASKVKARIYDSLFIRHFDSWRDEKRSHIFIVPIEGGEIKDITPGKYDVPPIALGGEQDFVFSPDGKEMCVVMNTDSFVPGSTNNDLFTITLPDGEPKRITNNKANDNSPLYSKDGRYIIYKAMSRPGFEADKYDLMLYDRGKDDVISLTKNLDCSPDVFRLSNDNTTIYFTCEEKAYTTLYKLNINDKKIEKVFGKVLINTFTLTPDNQIIVFSQQAANLPTELFTFDMKKKVSKQITMINKELLDTIEMNPIEEFWFKGAEGEDVHGLLMKPPFFDPLKKYPLVMLIHGGPQGAWTDEFHYRWNYQMFASAGYALAMINFHGSTGYGQAFTDSISGDWGGKPYEDIMLGLDYVLSHYDFIDKDKYCAAGASYGGYMINWIEGHADRFKCLISHAGPFDIRSKYGSTEELWFPEWEFKGTPWTNPDLYAKFSPSYYVQNFKTPCLVIHGQNDFRVTVEQGFQMFTALQRMGIPSKLLYFPDETHFVAKPQNAELWWKTVHEWLATYLKSQ